MKQETLEEAAKNYSIYNEQINKAIQEAVNFGANWQAKRMYSEEQVNELIGLLKKTTEYEVLQSFRDKVEQFKKK